MERENTEKLQLLKSNAFYFARQARNKLSIFFPFSKQTSVILDVFKSPFIAPASVSFWIHSQWKYWISHGGSQG